MIIRTLFLIPLPFYTENFETPSDIEFLQVNSGTEHTCSEYMFTQIQLFSEYRLFFIVLITLFKGVYHKRFMSNTEIHYVE